MEESLCRQKTAYEVLRRDVVVERWRIVWELVGTRMGHVGTCWDPFGIRSGT